MLIVAGLLFWGGALAVGAYLNNPSGWAGVVVATCSLGFVAFWGAMLALRQRRLRRSEAAGNKSDRFLGNGR